MFEATKQDMNLPKPERFEVSQIVFPITTELRKC